MTHRTVSCMINFANTINMISKSTERQMSEIEFFRPINHFTFTCQWYFLSIIKFSTCLSSIKIIFWMLWWILNKLAWVIPYESFCMSHTLSIHLENGIPRNLLWCCWRFITGTPILFIIWTRVFVFTISLFSSCLSIKADETILRKA